LYSFLNVSSLIWSADMTEFNADRRQVLAGAAVASVLAVGQAAPALAQGKSPAGFSAQPLPFDPRTITGLSEKLLVSHHDNNYAGAVKRLGAIDAQLAVLDLATAPGFQLNGLKREELIAWNSMVLHELYFAGLGAPSKPGAGLAAAIERDFGGEARWRAEFSAMGKALGGGSGWVLLTWSARDKRLVNTWAADHTMTLASGTPLLALDMYEHAYALDYGAKAGAYVDAFMATINWSHADALFKGVST
jgi:superoxide dismutase, Fe-Mn family